MIIRAVRPEETEALSDLAFRSKAYWGYDEAFMEACRKELTILPAHLSSCHLRAAEQDGVLLGFYRLSPREHEAELADFFVDPAAIGRQVGKKLWLHMLELARAQQIARVWIHSDPHAEGFYAKMGAVRAGDVRYTVFPDRELPLMKIDLTG